MKMQKFVLFAKKSLKINMLKKDIVKSGIIAIIQRIKEILHTAYVI